MPNISIEVVVENAEVSIVTAGDTYSYVALFTSEPRIILYCQKTIQREQ